MGAPESFPFFEYRRKESRRHVRTELSLSGRYVLSNGKECICRSLDISAGGLSLMGLEKGRIGERVVAYLEGVGRIEGVVARHFDDCLGVELLLTERQRERLGLKISALAGSSRKLAA